MQATTAAATTKPQFTVVKKAAGEAKSTPTQAPASVQTQSPATQQPQPPRRGQKYQAYQPQSQAVAVEADDDAAFIIPGEPTPSKEEIDRRRKKRAAALFTAAPSTVATTPGAAAAVAAAAAITSAQPHRQAKRGQQQQQQTHQQQPQQAGLPAHTLAAAAAAAGLPAPALASAPAGQRKLTPEETKHINTINELNAKLGACLEKLNQIHLTLGAKNVARDKYQMTIYRCQETLRELDGNVVEITKQKSEEEKAVMASEGAHKLSIEAAEKARARLCEIVPGMQVYRSLEQNYSFIDKKIKDLSEKLGRGLSSTEERKTIATINNLQRNAKNAAKDYDTKLLACRPATTSQHKLNVQYLESQIIHIRLQQATLMARIRESYVNLDKNRTDVPQIMTDRNNLLLEIKSIVAAMREARKQEEERQLQLMIDNYHNERKAYQAKLEEDHNRRRAELNEKAQIQIAKQKQIQQIVEADPYEEDIATCTDLIAYVEDMQRKHAVSSKSQKHAQPGKSKSWKSLAANQIQHRMGIFRFFEMVGVAAPLTPEEIPISLAALKEKKASLAAKSAAEAERKKVEASAKKEALNTAATAAPAATTTSTTETTPAQAPATESDKQAPPEVQEHKEEPAKPVDDIPAPAEDTKPVVEDKTEVEPAPSDS